MYPSFLFSVDLSNSMRLLLSDEMTCQTAASAEFVAKILKFNKAKIALLIMVFLVIFVFPIFFIIQKIFGKSRGNF